MFSPDGAWIAYYSDESGRNEVCVQAYPGPGRRWQVSTGGGTNPVWSPDGRELFYRQGRRMMVVPVRIDQEFSAGKPQLLFQGQFLPEPYDVFPDGSRFLMIQTEQDSESDQIHVVLNWFEELQRLVPAGN